VLLAFDATRTTTGHATEADGAAESGADVDACPQRDSPHIPRHDNAGAVRSCVITCATDTGGRASASARSTGVGGTCSRRTGRCRDEPHIDLRRHAGGAAGCRCDRRSDHHLRPALGLNRAMRGIRSVAGAWRGASFSLKFAAVIFVAGATVAVVPFLLAQANSRTQAENSAADKIGVASNLIGGQRAALDVFIAGVARQIAADHDAVTNAAIQATITADAEVLDTSDVLGVVAPDGAVVAVQGSRLLSSADRLTTTLLGAVDAGAATASTTSGDAWLVEASHLPDMGATAFVARPVMAAFISAIDHNIATTADPVDLLLIRADGRFALGGSVGGVPVTVGEASSSALRNAIAAGTPTVASLNSQQVAVASASIGAGFTLALTTPVTGAAVTWQSILLLLAVILVAMLFIVVVVQIDLRRPLRRLDAAVAALGNGDFDVPVPTSSVDEVGRLSASFEAMRVEVRSTMRATAARASVAMDLSLAQPLETALANVCDHLRLSLEVETAMIVVSGSEMSDGFAVAGGGQHIDGTGLLDGNGPLGEGYRHHGPGAINLGATATSREARLGVREFCVAPLRLGTYVHGAIAVASAHRAFSNGDSDLVASIAEQISLALERYRFLAVVQRQATVDDLTGLYNHRFLVDSLGQQLALAERLGAPLAILMLDLDHFKLLNDTHGHHAGDLALSAFARTLVNNVRRADLAARYGGEEFVVVMPDTSADEAFVVAEKIRLAVEETDVRLPGAQTVRLSVSIGVAAYPEHTQTAAELFSLADSALYRAKRTGRRRTCLAGTTLHGTPPHETPPMVQDAQVIQGEVNISAGRSRSP
jgi:diguanylate cyclase (GGDEF)-like protein